MSCQEKLAIGGKLVLALATLENLATCLAWFKKHQWDCSLQHIQISRSVPFANLTRLNPINPVNLITAQRLNNHTIIEIPPESMDVLNYPDNTDSFE
jgi:precorrin-6Y C5,15-methyltransferase (decarboxylating)